MIIKNLTQLDIKLDELEKKRIAYLEVDDKAGARRIKKQIEKLELEKEISNLHKIQQELEVYKNVVRNYPGISCEINKKLSELK